MRFRAVRWLWWDCWILNRRSNGRWCGVVTLWAAAVDPEFGVWIALLFGVAGEVGRGKSIGEAAIARAAESGDSKMAMHERAWPEAVLLVSYC